MITVLKLGGELLEDAQAIRRAVTAVLRIASRGSIAVVHGGGRAIDVELQRRGLTPRFADGLRVTDAETLDAVITVLAGRTNTQLVAAVNAAGGKAVGLTGADAQLGLCTPVAPIRTQSGEIVDLGLVGEPAPGRASLVEKLFEGGYVPVVASIGITADGALLNVNADTFAAHLASTLAADRLIIAGTTAGVLDAGGRTIPTLTQADIETMIAAGTAHSGMIAKLVACRHALAQGVGEVSIVAGRDSVDYESAPRTQVTAPMPTGSTGSGASGR